MTEFRTQYKQIRIAAGELKVNALSVTNPWINYHHLLYFKTIAEEGTVLAAAKKLRIGQPTLSAQLKQFESQIGVLLFERRQQRLQLTEQGRVALSYAKQIFRMGSEMYEVLHDRMKPLRPSVHLGSIDSVPKQVVISLVRAALQVSPCHITLSEGRPDELLRELASHRLDLLVTNSLPVGISAQGFHHRTVSRANAHFVGAPVFKKLRKNFPHSISGVDLILPTYDSKLRQDVEHWAKLNRIELNILIETQDVSVKRLLASNGLGLMVEGKYNMRGRTTGKTGTSSEQLIEVGQLRGVYEELHLVTAQRKIENAIASRLRDHFELLQKDIK